MANRANAHKVLKTDFAAARDEGLANVNDIIAEYQFQTCDIVTAKTTDTLRAYLLDQICFHVDNELRAGLDLYYQLAARHGLVEAAKEIDYLVANR
ncbi:MAG: hypothetical protein ACRD4L_10110, partial [Pyrinomonadaceae bacterium]